MIDSLRLQRGWIDRMFATGTYFFPRITNYWHPSLPWRPDIALALSRALDTPTAGLVQDQSPIAWAPKADYRGLVNKAGLPVDVRSGQVFAIDAAQYVLGLLDSGRELGHETRNRLAEGLIELGEATQAGLRFRCFTPAYGGAVASGWKSAMAQGQVASALLRLGRLDEAEAAIGEMCSGHGYITDELGGPALRECVDPYAGVVLNGHLIALIGLAEVAISRPALREVVEPFVKSLEEVASRFVTGSWSYYEIGGQRGTPPASAFYHRLHAELLDVWSTLTGSRQLRALADVCRLTDSTFFRLSALREKVAG